MKNKKIIIIMFIASIFFFYSDVATAMTEAECKNDYNCNGLTTNGKNASVKIYANSYANSAYGCFCCMPSATALSVKIKSFDTEEFANNFSYQWTDIIADKDSGTGYECRYDFLKKGTTQFGGSNNSANGKKWSDVTIMSGFRIFTVAAKANKNQDSKTITATFKNYDGTVVETRSCKGVSSCEIITAVPSKVEQGKVFEAWYLDDNSQKAYKNGISVKLDVSKGDRTFVAHFYTLKEEPQKFENLQRENLTATEDSPTGTGTCELSGNTEKIQTIKYYKITYNLNGGQFIDGSNSRVEYVESSKPLGSFNVAPIKKGYTFIGWKDANGNNYDFSKSPTSDMTLTASYEPYEDEGYYCESNEYIFNPTDHSCYKVLKFENGTANNIYQVAYNSAEGTTPTLGTAYNYTKKSFGTGTRFCYGAGVPNNDDEGGIFFTSSARENITGKNNAIYYFQEDGKFIKYEEQDYWKSEDNCKIKTSCSNLPCVSENSAELNSECSYTFTAMIYHRENAKLQKSEEEFIVAKGIDEIDKTDDEITTNSKTGNVLFIVALVIGLGALGYSIYYFVKRKKEA